MMIMKIKNLSILSMVLLALLQSEADKISDQQSVDGSAASYFDQNVEEDIFPTIKIENGKSYYYWPMWNQSKNRKMQVHRERTRHPDAQWWPHAGLGLFMHWGIVSEFKPSGEAWSGRWTEQREEKGIYYPQEEIWKVADSFNPKNYNPDKWMEGASRAGFKYAVLTTKHHDGYALWDSDWALMGVRQSLNGKDLIGPYVDACRKYNMKVGFYYSGMDWFFDRDYMNFAISKDIIVNYKGEKVSNLPKRPSSRWEAYKEFNENQVVELISKYKPDIWWGDGGHGASVEKIQALKPGIVCSNRGQGSGDHATPEGYDMVQPKFIKPILDNGWWWELCTIIQGGSWHYDINKGENINPTDAVLMQLAKVRCMGGNLLANIGPRPDGTLQDQVWRLFDEMETWMSTCGESVFGINGGGPWPHNCNVPITVKDRVWYFHSRKDQANKSKPIILTQCPGKPKSVTLLRTGEELSYNHKKGILRFFIPESLKAGNVTDVVKVEFNSDFNPEPYLFKHW